MTTLEKLRAAYVEDLIDLDTFEEFVGAVVAGNPVALPYEVQARYEPHYAMNAALKEMWTKGQHNSGAYARIARRESMYRRLTDDL